MIPKIIHYIWLGGKPLSKVAEKCISSWKKCCPDYDIKRWDETNLDLDKYQFVVEALKAGKYAFASDVLRTEILYNNGGIYLDVDVELIKPIDGLLTTNDCIMGFETSNLLNPGLFIATIKNNQDLKNILEIYKNLSFDSNNLINMTVCEIYTKYYERLGLKRENMTQQIGSTTIFASNYFSPIDVVTNKKRITKDTYSIHWYNASWYTTKQKLLKKLKKCANLVTFGLAGKVYDKFKNRKK